MHHPCAHTKGIHAGRFLCELEPVRILPHPAIFTAESDGHPVPSYLKAHHLGDIVGAMRCANAGTFRKHSFASAFLVTFCTASREASFGYHMRCGKNGMAIFYRRAFVVQFPKNTESRNVSSRHNCMYALRSGPVFEDSDAPLPWRLRHQAASQPWKNSVPI